MDYVCVVYFLHPLLGHRTFNIFQHQVAPHWMADWVKAFAPRPWQMHPLSPVEPLDCPLWFGSLKGDVREHEITCIDCIGNICSATLLRQSYGYGWYDNSPAPAKRGATTSWSSWKTAFTQSRYYHFLAPGQQLINQFPSQQSSAASDKETWAGHAISSNRTHPIHSKSIIFPKFILQCAVSLCVSAFAGHGSSSPFTCSFLSVIDVRQLSQRTIWILNPIDLDEPWWSMMNLGWSSFWVSGPKDSQRSVNRGPASRLPDFQTAYAEASLLGHLLDECLCPPCSLAWQPNPPWHRWWCEVLYHLLMLSLSLTPT